ncbi:KGK domain-containing protein [Dolichospermum circinale]|uniref:KGK domain-containing protein n=1 Tax=Dolichospermum circinale TaxID=109265 RepID=UPI0023314A75|nr:KGK domain-containing protein [Dolichospermum circinale]MDB9451151.1 KGK domain-containing protein [Dolichospermum circinale CS-547]
MEDNFKLIECNDDDVIGSRDWTYKVSKLKQALENIGNNSDFLVEFWNGLREQKIYYVERDGYSVTESFTEGMDAEILNLGSKSWKKGKLKFKLSVEFYVEEEEIEEIKEPESPLDDLRRMINDTTS